MAVDDDDDTGTTGGVTPFVPTGPFDPRGECLRFPCFAPDEVDDARERGAGGAGGGGGC